MRLSWKGTSGLSSKFLPSPILPGFFSRHGKPDGRLYLAPSGIEFGRPAAAALVTGNGAQLAGGPAVFTACHVLWREDGGNFYRSFVPFKEVLDWSRSEGGEIADFVTANLQLICQARNDFAGIKLGRPLLMGIVNVTPDSFFDGGLCDTSQKAVEHALRLADAGAAILDIGGESTRPGADPVSEEIEIERVLPVIEELSERGLCVSVDTRHSSVMAAAIAKGARIINDISALEGDSDSLKIVSCSDVSVVLMHMQGKPGTMQNAPFYDSAALSVYDYLMERIRICQQAGIGAGRLCVDPGIGFGKNLEHNQEILNLLCLYHGLAVPVLLGASRKSFIASSSSGEKTQDRLPGSLAAVLSGLGQGVQIFRVHDVAETRQAIAVWQGIYQ